MLDMRFEYFIPSTFKAFVAACKHIFEMGEPGLFFFFPKTDRERRIGQLIQDYSFNIRVDKLQLNTQIVDEVSDVESYIREVFPKKKSEILGVFVLRSEIAIFEGSSRFIDSLIELQASDPTYRFIFTSETDFTHPQIVKHLSSQTRIFSNVNYYPLYDEKDSSNFIDHLCKEWRYSLAEKKKQQILEYCGGHFWLLKELVRKSLIEPDRSVDDICLGETMHFRLEQIYFGFLESESEVLKHFIAGQTSFTDLQRHSADYLNRIGLIKNGRITIPLLEKYIKDMLPKVNMSISENHIIINNVIVDSHFSRKELKALRLLMQHRQNIVDRDAVAKAVWPVDTDSHYSEWAIDRIIARLREKLIKLGIEKQFITTLRGKGYIIRI